jgi:BirA family transcriptional regulator, biotin operon repressor / biotin---[acetyl-CoA-carboxylase] ligase
MQRDPVDIVTLQDALVERWPRIVVVDEDESTNATLMHDPSAPDRSVLVAEYQTAGRGRLERSWTSPRGAGLTFSVVLRPQAPIRTWGWLPLLAGVALREALADATGLALSLKWPNDLLCAESEGKLAGILAQTSGEAVVIGVGLNVTTTRAELPVETASSLELCGARDPDRTRLLVSVLRRLDARAAQWDDVAGDAEACALADDYRRHCATLGREVTVTTTDGAAITGRALDIDADGRLLVQRDDRVEAVGAGDVEHLRPRA